MDVLRKRELKWLEMIDSWDRYMATKYKKVFTIRFFLAFLQLTNLIVLGEG